MSEPANETAAERLQRYLRMADEARDLAGRSGSLDVRESGLEMAAQWLVMAAGAERQITGPCAGVGLQRAAPAERAGMGI